MNQKGISSIVIILIIVGALIVAGAIWAWQNQKEKPVACNQDAKLCPDGSYVSRTGPNCEFAACPETKNEIANWKTYRNETYGFELKYPSYLTLKKETIDRTGLIHGSRLEHYSFKFSPDPGNVFWGALSIYDINNDINFSIYSIMEYSWVFYDPSTSKWYVSGEGNIGALNPPRTKKKEYQPFSNSKTLGGVPIYSGFGYGDMGSLLFHQLIIIPNSGIVIVFLSFFDGNALDFESKEIQELSQKFSDDLQTIIQSVKFTR